MPQKSRGIPYEYRSRTPLVFFANLESPAPFFFFKKDWIRGYRGWKSGEFSGKPSRFRDGNFRSRVACLPRNEAGLVNKYRVTHYLKRLIEPECYDYDEKETEFFAPVGQTSFESGGFHEAFDRYIVGD